MKCRKFGEKSGYSYSCQIDRYDIEIGDTITVAGCERENDFHILTIYKDESYFESRSWMLVGTNVMIILGIMIFCPWSSRFGISAIVIAGFLLFQEPQKLYCACLDLYEGAVVIENAEVSFEYERNAAHRGDPYLYYAVLSKGTELDNKKIELLKAVYSYYTEVFRRPDNIVYYKNLGILTRFGK